MRRFGIALVLVIAVAFGWLQVLQPAVARAGTPVSTGMTLANFDADLYLSKGADNRSKLRTVEHIAVRFQANGSLHGIERSIPSVYDGHKTHPKVVSVREQKQGSMQYTTYTSNDNLVVRIGDPNKIVTGDYVYTIEYEQSDVTRNLAGHDEFYWDINGTEWGVATGQVTARVHVDSSLSASLDGRSTCFEGAEGIAKSCKKGEVTTEESESKVFHFGSTGSLFAGENVSVVIGFKSGTFAPYKKTFLERWMSFVSTFRLKVGLVILAVIILKILKELRRNALSPKAKTAIIPEYLPPKGMSILQSSTILGRTGSDVSAQIIDLAVRHYIRIYEREQKKRFWGGASKRYDLELIKNPAGLLDEERRLIEIIFGVQPAVPTTISLEGAKMKLYKAADKLVSEVKKTTKASGFFQDKSSDKRSYRLLGAGLLILAVLILNPFIAVAGVLLLIVSLFFEPLSESGVSARNYLKGLAMYIGLAEADRLKMLQSPEGAQKLPVKLQTAKDGDAASLVKLYERLLPYAMLFGMEKGWAKQLAPLYGEGSPDWFVGNAGAFNAAAFGSSLNSFNAVSNTTFSSPTSSSSSGFSSGGGFSGGGGGGGGGGAW